MKKIKVLLAEDHAVVREGIRELICQQQDMEVVGEAEDGEETVQLVEQLKPNLVLMDIAMPKLNGIEATRRIKESHPSTSVLVLTAYDNEEFIFALVEAGAVGYLLKNVRGQELLNAIRATYDGESVLYPTIAEKVFKRLQLEGKIIGAPGSILLKVAHQWLLLNRFEPHEWEPSAISYVRTWWILTLACSLENS